MYQEESKEAEIADHGKAMARGGGAKRNEAMPVRTAEHTVKVLKQVEKRQRDMA